MQSGLGPHCLSMLVDDKKHTVCDYALEGLINVSSVCMRLGFS